MNNVLLDVISTGKFLKAITPEEHKPGLGGVRISGKSGNFQKIKNKKKK